jgi:hypothetical protein
MISFVHVICNVDELQWDLVANAKIASFSLPNQPVTNGLWIDSNYQWSQTFPAAIVCLQQGQWATQVNLTTFSTTSLYRILLQ